MSSVSNGLYFLTLPLVSVMHVIYRKIRHALYLYIKRNVEKVWGARYLSKKTVDATECFIALIIFSTCFGHLYTHHQKLETILVLLPCMVRNSLVADGRLLGVEQQAMRPG